MQNSGAILFTEKYSGIKKKTLPTKMNFLLFVPNYLTSEKSIPNT